MPIYNFPDPKPKPIVVRSVYADTLDAEFKQIAALVDTYPIITMDTEFPGVVVPPSAGFPCYEKQPPATYYLQLKANVDLLSLIQVGITISNGHGDLPDLGTGCRFIWEFNFKDFDVTRDFHDSGSVELLKRQGIDFEKNRNKGIDSYRFAELMLASGLVCNDSVSWVTFHGSYDFGYLVKILTRQKLPSDMNEFLDVLRTYFGVRVYDVKHMTRFCSSLHGGLDRVSKTLGVDRIVGKGHQAGSDSLLTWHAYQKITEIHFCEDDIDKFASVLYGLEVN